MSSELPALPDPQLRVAASDRDIAASTLREAAGEGRITFDELESRLPQAMTAVTRQDLYAVLGDLVPAEKLPTLFDGNHPHSDAPGMSWDNPLVIRAKWDGATREGVWDVPPFMEVVTAQYGPVYLSFLEARPLASVIDLVLTGNGRVDLVVPEGWGVDLQQLESAKSSNDWTKSTTAISSVPTRPARGMARIVVSGQTVGDVRVREPKASDLRRHRKAMRRAN